MAKKWWTLAVVSVALFMLLLDITVVNVALPSIAHDLHATFEELQWVVDAYALTLSACLLAAGSASDRHGRKRLFSAGLLCFTGSSALSGFAPSPAVLDAARGLQGTGGAMMFSTSLALLGHSFQGRERGVAFGTFGAVTGISVAIGPLIGGAVTTGLGWRWVFFLNIPLGLLALLATMREVEESRDPQAGPTDWWGMAAFSGALFLLVLALVQGNERGWSSPLIVGSLTAAAALLALFFRRSRTNSHPLLDLSLFRVQSFAGISAVAFALSAAVFALLLYLSLYFQLVLRYSPLQAGLRFLPATLAMFAIAPIAGRLSVRLPVRALLGGGLLLCGIGLGLFTVIDARSSWTVMIPGFVVQGIGVGLVNPPLAASAIGVVPPHKGGMASGINSTFRQVGIATGVAAFGAIFQHLLVAGTVSRLRNLSLLRVVQEASGHHLRQDLITGELAPLLSGLKNVGVPLFSTYRAAFVGALEPIFWIAAGLAFSGAALALALVRARDFAASAGHTQTAPAAV